MGAPNAIEQALYALLTGSGAITTGWGNTSRWTLSGLGLRVNRAAAADPQNVWLNIFTIAGGAILATSLTGIRTVDQGGGASNMQFRHDTPATVLCAATAIGIPDLVGTLYTITGNFADAITKGATGAPILAGIAGGLLATGNQGWGILMMAGNIQVTMTAAAGTGSTRYVLTYIPLDDAATVVAA